MESRDYLQRMIRLAVVASFLMACGTSAGTSTPASASATPVSTFINTPAAVPTPTSTKAVSAPTHSPTPVLVEAAVGKDGKVYLGDLMILNPAEDDLGCFGVGTISYAPTGDHFLVVLDCFEGDNDAFLFRADGSDKRRITSEWDYINYHDFEWASDGLSFIYQRINDCCVAPPPDAPPAGRVRYDIRTGEKALVSDATTPSTRQAIFLRPSCGQTYVAQAGNPIEIAFGAWGAKGIEQAKNNATHLTVRLLIDNQPVLEHRRRFLPPPSIPCGNVPADSYWIVHTATIDPLPSGRHAVEVSYIFDMEVTDGYDSDKDGTLDYYEADKPIRQSYIIVVQ